MIILFKVTDKAVEKVKKEIEGMATDVKEPFIRLFMSVG